MFYFLGKAEVTPKQAVENISHLFTEKKSDIKQKKVPEKKLLSSKYTGDLYQWLGKTPEELQKHLGNPERKDLSAYGYTWWVYTDQKQQYIQFGVDDNKITSVFAMGKSVSAEPVKIGQSYNEVKHAFSFPKEVTYDKGLASYQFLLKNEDVNARPLVKLSDNLFMQCYFDTFTKKLSAIRIIDGDTLLKHRPYELKYRGSLPKTEKLTDAEWKKIEKGMEQQIFDMTNVVRNSFNKPSLKWDDSVSEVAYLHSKDMAENNYFSHYGLDGTGLKERLAAKKVFYFAAGENIAAQYPDAPAAMHGWLNSKGHREALLNKDYTNLGVGVYKFYYTQNFLAKPM
ncbi:CAP domain-containing protein [Virgibacillus sp. 179-BFC.A HS]|uniref:CAP domain-containing protein n=1 Tax=Tigheibacillus jepli TaxID=3035914 RepID=A0ABU5CJL0_9BACI|nr:CAP domain-containing protein [Virgibacillus sp. 179-BFC.A HS]MDY0405989.1 CAP domain-containing protein [Virgibacillus sp. 179-BFC.A HS]